MTTPRLLSNRYELGETLGYGGMSEVHHGHDVRLGREVAVKVLRADLARDPQFQERFRREAQNAAALNHPAIVAVYDTGETNTEHGPLPYIVMEFVEGRTLRDIVKTEGPLPQRRAMEVMADVCAALDFSHRHGIVHRDVKPANIMITTSGAVKVMDFGIARAIHDGQAAMTQTAAVIGTAQYLSPEQARGEQVDARSDVYAAGCVLYELLTGEPPFTGDSPVAVAYQHVREDPNPPSSVNPQVAPELDAVVLKALSKGPANRYQSSAEMRSDLVRTLSGQRPSAPMVMSDDERTQVMNSRRPQPAYNEYDDDYYDEAEEERRRRKKRNLIAAGLAALGVAVVLVVLFALGLFDSKAENVAVPSLAGKSPAAASDELRQIGLIAQQVPVSCHAQSGGAPTCTDDQIGKVIDSDPAAGTQVATNTQIKLRVGTAPKKVQVPDLKGKTRDEAAQALQAQGLQLDQNTKETDVSDPSQYSKVQSQDPGANVQAEEGDSVSITLGRTPDFKEITNYVGKDYDTAEAGLKGAGFKVQRKDVSSAAPEDQVVEQTPNGGPQPEGSTVTLSVSDGSQEKIEMPDLTGKTESQALATLRAQGWKGDYTKQADPSGSSDQAGKVTSTNPSAGTQITKSQSLTLYIGEQDDQTSPPTSSSGNNGLPIPGG